MSNIVAIAPEPEPERNLRTYQFSCIYFLIIIQSFIFAFKDVVQHLVILVLTGLLECRLQTTCIGQFIHFQIHGNYSYHADSWKL